MRKVVIPFGPQHPALKEPESFSITLSGERIMAFSARLGYNHRGIEKACEERTYIQDVFLTERICGICSHTHSTTFVQAIEEIAALSVPKRALYIRTIIGELERIHSHLLWLGIAGHEIGFDTLLMYTWRDREIVMDILEKLTGNRVNYGINTIGGVRRDIESGVVKDIVKGMGLLEKRAHYYIELARTETTLIQRLSGIGILSHDDAISLGAIGPTGRASGVPYHVRRNDPYAAYPELSFDVITDDHCDVYGRTIVRLGEVLQACSLIKQAAENLPEGPLAVRAPRKIPAGEAVSRYEAPRGENIHYIRSNGTDKPDRVKVRAPTLANMQGVARMLEDRQLADLPIVIAAIDPCFSCTDRMIAVHKSPRGASHQLGWDDLRTYGIAWYAERGIDCSKINMKI